MKRIVWITFAIWWAVFSYGASVSAQPAEISLRIIGMNDFHGALVETDTYAGAAKLASAVTSLRDEADGAVLVFAAGDMMQGTMESNLERGQTVVRMMNRIGIDAMTVGNHEFDWGLDVLTDRTSEMEFPCLGANVIERDSGKVLSCLQPYTLLEKNGVKVGIVGVVTQDTITSVNPKNIATLRIEEPIAIAKETIRQVREKGADIVVLLAHMACYQEENGTLTGEAVRLAELDGVDVIVSGHSHTQIVGTIGDVIIVQAGDKGRYLDIVDIIYSPEQKKIISRQAGLDAIDGRQVLADGEVVDLVKEATRHTEKMKQTEVGRLPAILVHDRRAVSPLGSWVADGIRMVSGTDIALQNGGGIRVPSLGTQVTEGNLYEMLPFDNIIYTAELTGREIKAVLEQGLFDETHSILQYAGLTVVCDADRPHGARITEICLTDGSMLQEDAVYTVAYNDFMAAGGDGYPYLSTASKLCNTGISLREAVEEYLQTAGGQRLPNPRFYLLPQENKQDAA